MSTPRTVGEARVHARRELADAGIPDAALEADLIVRHVTGATRLALLQEPGMVLSPAQAEACTQVLTRRLTREPLAYVFGSCEFYGLEFHVDPRVLIPRPETELLVERVIYAAGDLMRRGVPGPLVADIGTGSGCVAIALAVNLPSIRVCGVDVSLPALDVARVNCHNQGVEGRVMLLRGDLAAALSPIHLLVANLPYVRSTEVYRLAPEISFEPHLALDGGPAGLRHISRLLQQLRERVLPGGSVLLEVGYNQARAVAGMAALQFPHAVIGIHRDLGGIERVVEIGPLTATFLAAAPGNATDAS